MIGIDIIEIERIAGILQRYGDRFLRRVFSEEEIALYKKHRKRLSFLAGRFAAKEAVIKASGRYISWDRIEILGEEKPYAKIEGNTEIPLMLSISHTKTLAVAVAVILDYPLTADARK